MDKLLLLKGEPYQVTNLVSVINPTIGEIAKFGEERYWGMLSQICATSFDYRLVLEEIGIDYLEIDDWHMFLNCRYSFKYEETSLLIPNIDFAKLKLYEEENTGRLVLANDKGEAVIDEAVYHEMIGHIRKCHGLQRNYKIPGNQTARDVYMREAREARQYAGNKKFESQLEPLISALCNISGFEYNYDTVWDLNIYSFMNAVKRIQKIQSADHLMSGLYSGMLDTSKMNKGQLNKDLNWLGELK